MRRSKQDLRHPRPLLSQSVCPCVYPVYIIASRRFRKIAYGAINIEHP